MNHACSGPRARPTPSLMLTVPKAPPESSRVLLSLLRAPDEPVQSRSSRPLPSPHPPLPHLQCLNFRLQSLSAATLPHPGSCCKLFRWPCPGSTLEDERTCTADYSTPGHKSSREDGLLPRAAAGRAQSPSRLRYHRMVARRHQACIRFRRLGAPSSERADKHINVRQALSRKGRSIGAGAHRTGQDRSRQRIPVRRRTRTLPRR